jgi:hypothetical protein
MPDPLPITPLAGPFDATIRPPGSKSLTNRALLLAALAEGRSTLTGLLLSEDTRVMIEALARVGIDVDLDEPALIATVSGAARRLPASNAELNLQNAGTATRFLTAAACLGAPGAIFRIDGNARMRQRPIGQLVDALRELGADIEYLGEPGCPPLRVTSTGLAANRVELPTTMSSQYISALLQIGPCLDAGLTGDLVGRDTDDIAGFLFHLADRILGVVERFGRGDDSRDKPGHGDDRNPIFLHPVDCAQTLGLFECHEDIGLAVFDHRGIDLGTDPHVRGNDAAALRHTVDLGLLDIEPAVHGGGGDDLAGEQHALAADTNYQDILRIVHDSLLCLHELTSQNDALFRTDLRAQGAAGAQ